MIFSETRLQGAFVVDLEPIADGRGFFARSWCRKEFEKNGLNTDLAQCNLSFNHRKGTVRGMHFQLAPYREVKLVRCIRGAIYDVIVDLRSDSATFKSWVGVELSAESRRMFYVPEGFAHGYQTIVDNSEVFYQTSQFYQPDAECGYRWNDPAFGIQWPHEVTQISNKDKGYPDIQL